MPGMSAAFRKRLEEGRSTATLEERVPVVLEVSHEAVLAFECAHARWGREAKRRAIRAELGISETRYVQLLLQAIDGPAAARWPILSARLRAERDARRARREIGIQAALEGVRP